MLAHYPISRKRKVSFSWQAATFESDPSTTFLAANKQKELLLIPIRSKIKLLFFFVLQKVAYKGF